MKQNLDSRSRMGGYRRFYANPEDAGVEASGASTDASAAVEQAEQAVRAADLLGEMIGGNQRRRAGIRLNGTFFPFSDIMLFGILLTAVVIAVRLK